MTEQKQPRKVTIESATVKYLQKLSKLLKDGEEMPTGMQVSQAIDSQGHAYLTQVKIKCQYLPLQ